MDQRFHSPQRPFAESRRDLLEYFAMPNRVFFPDNATKVFPSIVEICLDEELDVLFVGRINICKGYE
jgi:hypothetical protein